jgi:hypothetical protein
MRRCAAAAPATAAAAAGPAITPEFVTAFAEAVGKIAGTNTANGETGGAAAVHGNAIVFTVNLHGGANEDGRGGLTIEDEDLMKGLDRSSALTLIEALDKMFYKRFNSGGKPLPTGQGTRIPTDDRHDGFLNGEQEVLKREITIAGGLAAMDAACEREGARAPIQPDPDDPEKVRVHRGDDRWETVPEEQAQDEMLPGLLRRCALILHQRAIGLERMTAAKYNRRPGYYEEILFRMFDATVKYEKDCSVKFARQHVQASRRLAKRVARRRP